MEKAEPICRDVENNIVRCITKSDYEVLPLIQIVNMLESAKGDGNCSGWILLPDTAMFVLRWFNGGELLQVLVGDKIGYIASYKWLNIKKIQ